MLIFIGQIEWIHTSSFFTVSAASFGGAIVVVVDDVVVVLFAFGTLPNIKDVALSASAHPIIPIMAAKKNEKQKCETK